MKKIIALLKRIFASPLETECEDCLKEQAALGTDAHFCSDCASRMAW